VIDNGLLVQMLLGALLGLSVYLPLAAGQLSLATPAFYAVGGTLAALLSTRWSVLGAADNGTFPWSSFGIEVVLGGLLAGAMALVVGSLVLRLQGIYLAIATIALVEIVRVAILNLPFTGGAIGIFGIPQPFASAAGYLIPALTLLALTGWICHRLELMPLGRAMAAIRDDELAARCMGINTTRVKLMAFVLSAMVAGSTGVLAAHFLNTWNARQGSFDRYHDAGLCDPRWLAHLAWTSDRWSGAHRRTRTAAPSGRCTAGAVWSGDLAGTAAVP
jgi:branched-chain amino acid transport system permease protein